MSSSDARAQVRAARRRQATRLRSEGVRLNAHMDARMLGRHARLPSDAERMLSQARERGMMSARGAHRVLRVARTIADLEGRERISTKDLGEAIALRGEAGVRGHAAG